MSQTAHMALRDAVVALMLAPPALAGGRVVANRRRPMPQAVDSQIFVYLEEAPANPQAMGTSAEWQTRVRIECAARTADGVQAEDAADALAAAAYGRVMADPRLGGLALDTVCHLAWTEDEADTSLSAAQVLCILRHRTPRNSIA